MTNATTMLDQVLRASEQLPHDQQLRLISLLSERLAHELSKAGEAVDMLSLAGLGQEIWQEMDTDAYLEQERASWQI